jgi:signal peptidase II
VIIVAVVLADQLTKAWVVSALTNQPPRHIFGDALMFTLVYNEGGAMGTNLGSVNYYRIIALIILPLIGYYLWRNRHDRPFALPLAFILGGAIGNQIDRFRLGRVVDFVDVDVPDIHLSWFQMDRFWTFNVADSAITCAIVFVLLHVLFSRHTTSAPSDMPPALPPDSSL